MATADKNQKKDAVKKEDPKKAPATKKPAASPKKK